MNQVTQIRAARLAEFEDRAGTGHSVIDVKQLVAECRRYRNFLSGLADEVEAQGFTELSQRLRAAATAPGE